MSAWGPGPFENDEAQGYVGDVVRRTISDIERDIEAFKRKVKRRPDPIRILAAVGVLRILAKGEVGAACAITKSQVEKWRKFYTNWFEREGKSLIVSRSVQAFRSAASREFRALTKLAALAAR